MQKLNTKKKFGNKNQLFFENNNLDTLKEYILKRVWWIHYFIVIKSSCQFHSKMELVVVIKQPLIEPIDT